MRKETSRAPSFSPRYRPTTSAAATGAASSTAASSSPRSSRAEASVMWGDYGCDEGATGPITHQPSGVSGVPNCNGVSSDPRRGIWRRVTAMIDASPAVLPPMFRSANAEVRVSEESGTTVVAGAGGVDLARAEMLDDTLRVLATRASGRVVVDLAHVTFMDTAGLRTLVVARSRMDAAGRWL